MSLSIIHCALDCALAAGTKTILASLPPSFSDRSGPAPSELRSAVERAMILEEPSLIAPPSLLAHALEKTNGNQTQAARLLRITRDTLRYKMKKFNLR